MPDGGGYQRYVLRANEGQGMQVYVTSDNAPVRFDVTGPNGTIWQAVQYGSEVYVHAAAIVLPRGGDYVVTLTSPPGAPATLYDVTFTIR
jgi:hypothetical protein